MLNLHCSRTERHIEYCLIKWENFPYIFPGKLYSKHRSSNDILVPIRTLRNCSRTYHFSFYNKVHQNQMVFCQNVFCVEMFWRLSATANQQVSVCRWEHDTTRNPFATMRNSNACWHEIRTLFRIQKKRSQIRYRITALIFQYKGFLDKWWLKIKWAIDIPMQLWTRTDSCVLRSIVDFRLKTNRNHNSNWQN